MTSRLSLAFFASMLMLSGCSAAAPPAQVTPVIAGFDEERSFAGVWRGAVQSAHPRFTGEVEFRFTPGGAVIIPPQPVPARILWVRVSSAGVSGALQSYFDAARGAEVYTTFEGSLRGTTLTGVLRERMNGRWEEIARWEVKRVEEEPATDYRRLRN